MLLSGHIVYRDLKPDNILIDAQGHVQVTDFGLAKRNVTTAHGATTFCGSFAYGAPEVVCAWLHMQEQRDTTRSNGGGGKGGGGRRTTGLKSISYGKAVDWWALGTLIYEMLAGLPPFYNINRYQMVNDIVHKSLICPTEFSASVQVFLVGLLQKNPEKRFGSGENEELEIKSSPFFNNIDWMKLDRREIIPPWCPGSKKRSRQESGKGGGQRNDRQHSTDASNFDTEFISFTSSGVASVQSESYRQMRDAGEGEFKNFSFAGGSDKGSSSSRREETDESLSNFVNEEGSELGFDFNEEDVNQCLSELQYAKERLMIEKNLQEKENLMEEIKQLKEIYAEMMDGDPNEDLFDGFSGEY